MKYLALLVLALSLAWTADGQDAAYWLGQAARDYSNGSYSLAIDDIDNYLEQNSSDVNGWNIKASILLKMERYNEAAECFDQVIEMDSSDAKAWNDKTSFAELGEQGGIRIADGAFGIDPNIPRLV
jgi:tetratricopeptide (TPR) repeat protein